MNVMSVQIIIIAVNETFTAKLETNHFFLQWLYCVLCTKEVSYRLIKINCKAAGCIVQLKCLAIIMWSCWMLKVLVQRLMWNFVMFLFKNCLQFLRSGHTFPSSTYTGGFGSLYIGIYYPASNVPLQQNKYQYWEMKLILNVGKGMI